MSDEAEVLAVNDPSVVPPVVADPIPVVVGPGSILAATGPMPVTNPTAVHGVLETLEAEWAKFKDLFEAKLADIRSHL